jgi:hypothetical protein
MMSFSQAGGTIPIPVLMEGHQDEILPVIEPEAGNVLGL